MDKNIGNAVAGGGFVTTALGILNTAMWTDSLFDFLSKWGIGLFPFYVWGMFSFLIWIFLANWDFWIKKIRESHRGYDIAALDAVSYMADLSVYGQSIPEEIRFDACKSALFKAALNGNILLWGMDGLNIRKINKKEIASLEITEKHSEGNLFLVLSRGKDIVFPSIFTEMSKVRKIWIQK